MDKDKVLLEFEKALYMAITGRPGPVLIDLPVDIQGSRIEYTEPPVISKPEIYKKTFRLWDFAFERPLILAGGGIRAAHATKEFREFVHETGIPVVVSLMGLDVMDHSDECFVGFIGGYGNRYANMAVQNADLILVLGSRLDMRQTGKRRDLFAPNAKIIHVDIDPTELGHYVEEECSIQADVKTFLQVELRELPNEIKSFDEWKRKIHQWKEYYSDASEFEEQNEWNPNRLLNIISRYIARKTIVTSDVGQNQMWLAQSLRADEIRILNSGGLGTMGYSLPAAIGACFGKIQDDVFTTVVAYMGDGGLQMNIQELQVVGSYRLPIAVVVWNNHALGLIRDIQKKYYDCRYVGSVTGFSTPDLEQLAKAYRLNYCKVSNISQLEEIFSSFSDLMPIIIEIVLDENTYVRPELLGQDGLDHQFPYR